MSAFRFTKYGSIALSKVIAKIFTPVSILWKFPLFYIFINTRHYQNFKILMGGVGGHRGRGAPGSWDTWLGHNPVRVQVGPRGHMAEPALLPLTFEDVAIYFSEQEWRNLEAWQKELYKQVMRTSYEILVSLRDTGLSPGLGRSHMLRSS